MDAVLILTGAPGTGKSSVLDSLATLLEVEGVEYGAIESEQLAWGSPLLPALQWAAQLEAVLAFQRHAGRSRFLVAATVETADELRLVANATRGERLLVVCLTAQPELVAARIAEREPDTWPGKAALIARARGLAEMIPTFDGVDLVVETDVRSAEETAARVYEEMQVRGLAASTREGSSSD